MSDQSDDVALATSIVRAYKRATASLLQRRMNIDYARADGLLDQLEHLGIISSPDDQGQRHII